MVLICSDWRCPVKGCGYELVIDLEEREAVDAPGTFEDRRRADAITYVRVFVEVDACVERRLGHLRGHDLSPAEQIAFLRFEQPEVVFEWGTVVLR